MCRPQAAAGSQPAARGTQTRKGSALVAPRRCALPLRARARLSARALRGNDRARLAPTRAPRATAVRPRRGSGCAAGATRPGCAPGTIVAARVERAPRLLRSPRAPPGRPPLPGAPRGLGCVRLPGLLGCFALAAGSRLSGLPFLLTAARQRHDRSPRPHREATTDHAGHTQRTTTAALSPAPPRAPWPHCEPLHPRLRPAASAAAPPTPDGPGDRSLGCRPQRLSVPHDGQNRRPVRRDSRADLRGATSAVDRDHRSPSAVYCHRRPHLTLSTH